MLVATANSITALDLTQATIIISSREGGGSNSHTHTLNLIGFMLLLIFQRGISINWYVNYRFEKQVAHAFI